MNSTIKAYQNNPDGDTRIEAIYNNPLCREFELIIKEINNPIDYTSFITGHYYNFIRNINLVKNN